MSKKKKKVEENGQSENITISAPNFKVAKFKIIGTSPYVQNKFPEKAKNQMREKQLAGGLADKSKKRPPRDYDRDYREAQYVPKNSNWPNGAIPATAIKAAMVAACRLVDFKMTVSKQCFTVVAEDYDVDERIPLIRITKGKPSPCEQALRVANGNPDIRVRPLWEAGWEAIVTIRYDADRFTITDVANLLLRAGLQVGIGEGRTASRQCVGLGWGEFKIDGK